MALCGKQKSMGFNYMATECPALQQDITLCIDLLQRYMWFFFYCKWSCMVVLLNSSSVLLCSSWFFALPPHLYKPCHTEVCEETVVNCFVPRKKKCQIIKWKLSHFLVKYNINYSFFFFLNNLVENILHTKHNCFLNLTV